MSSLTVTPVSTDAQLREFVDFPWKVYADSPLWVPPLKSDDKKLLTPDAHPFWKTARRELFLAHRDGRTVGRIAAIIDDKHNEYWQEKSGAFGFYECLDDDEASKALFTAAWNWLKNEGARFMRGPLSPSTNYTCGLLVHGFDEAPAIMMPWNPPYYARQFEAFHLRKEQDLLAYVVYKDSLTTPEWLQKELARIKEKGEFTLRPSSKKTLADDARIMLDLYRESWAKNFCFSPLSPEESEILVKDLVTYLDPRFFVLFNHGTEAAGGMVAFPDYTPLMHRINGRLGPLLPWHYLRTRSLSHRGYRVLLFGVREEYRLMGLPLLLFDYMLQQTKASKEFQWVEGSWVLEDNAAVCEMLEDFSGRVTKRYRIYRKEII